MTYQDFFSNYEKKKKLPLPHDHNQRVGASLSVQIHSTGARPAYQIGAKHIIPETYDERFIELFKTRLLNRHYNESDDSYNLRLAIYSPVAKEIFDRFMNMCTGAIMQPNNYMISVDEKTQEYFREYDIDHEIKEGIEFIMNNPKGFMGVILANDTEFDNTKPTKPELIYLCPHHILMDDGKSMGFCYEDRIYFVDATTQVSKIKGDPNAIEIVHNFGEIPIWDVDNNFTQPFSLWADLLVRNMSDDEISVKNYSFPIKQTIRPTCPTCNGNKTLHIQHIEGDPTSWKTSMCLDCRGTGVISINPTELFTMSEDKLAKMNYIFPDLAKFITPDIAIPEYHLKRWQVFYERCEKSLRLNPIHTGVQSGEAKKEDRKDQYTFLSTISQFLFENVEKAIGFISAYKNFDPASGTYKKQSDIVVVAPKQLDLMTDGDLIDTLTLVQTKTDDSMVLGEYNYAVQNKIYRDDKLQNKINEIMYEVDPLYGASGLALKAKMLSGIYDTRDKIIHEKGYTLLKQIAREMTPKAFIESDYSVLTAKLDEKIASITPANVYNA